MCMCWFSFASFFHLPLPSSGRCSPVVHLSHAKLHEWHLKMSARVFSWWSTVKGIQPLFIRSRQAEHSETLVSISGPYRRGTSCVWLCRHPVVKIKSTTQSDKKNKISSWHSQLCHFRLKIMWREGILNHLALEQVFIQSVKQAAHFHSNPAQ